MEKYSLLFWYNNIFFYIKKVVDYSTTIREIFIPKLSEELLEANFFINYICEKLIT